MTIPRFAFGLSLALLASPLWAQTAATDLHTQAMLLGPARMETTAGQLTIFGEAGTMSYVALATGPDCSADGAACDRISFQAVAPPPDGGDPVATWQGTGLGGTLRIGGDGWLVLTDEAGLDDPSAAFQSWGRLMNEFQARFGR